MPGYRPSVREQRPPAPRSRKTEPLAATGQPCLQIAAEGSWEKQEAIGIFMAQTPEMEKAARPGRRQRPHPVGESGQFQQRTERRLCEQRDLRIGPGGAERAQQRQHHDNVAEPVGQADPQTRLAREGGEPAALEIGAKEIAFGFKAQPPGGNVLVAPAVVRPQPGGAGVVTAGKVGLQPAVERNGHARSGPIVDNARHVQLHPPEGESARKDHVEPGMEFLRQQPGELGGGTDAAEQRGKSSLKTGILIKEKADAAVAPEDLHSLLKSLLAREQAHAEPFP